MKKGITRDSSETFLNDVFQETYHSVTGAVEEAFEKFAKPSLEFIGERKEVNVLDFCFGLGYNTAAILDLIHCKVNVVGTDNDEKIFDLIKQVSPEIKSYYLIKKLSKEALVVKDDDVKIELMLGNAIKIIQDLPENFFDVVLFDPFSPKVCPELWSKPVFEMLFKLMKNNSVLTTYSCARLVRDNLKNSGFIVKDGPKVGRRGPSTIAVKNYLLK